MSQLEESRGQPMPGDTPPDRVQRSGAPGGDRSMQAHTESGAEISEDEVRRRAYERYVARGESEGSETDDWLAAERELRERDGGTGNRTDASRADTRRDDLEAPDRHERMGAEPAERTDAGERTPRASRTRRDRPMRGERAD